MPAQKEPLVWPGSQAAYRCSTRTLPAPERALAAGAGRRRGYVRLTLLGAWLAARDSGLSGLPVFSFGERPRLGFLAAVTIGAAGVGRSIASAPVAASFVKPRRISSRQFGQNRHLIVAAHG